MRAHLVLLCALAAARPALSGPSLEAEADAQSERLRTLEAQLAHGSDVDARAKFSHHGVRDLPFRDAEALSRGAALAVSARDAAGTRPGSSCGSAMSVVLGSPTSGSNAGFPSPGGVPDKCGKVSHTGSSAVWYVVPKGVKGTVYATTCGSDTDFDTQVTVLRGSCGGTLECVSDGDDDAFCGTSNRQSTVTFTAKAEETYYVLVHGYKDKAGKFRLTIGSVDVTVDRNANHESHQTDRYRAEDGTPLRDLLVVRRGQMFDVSVTSAEALSNFRLRLPSSAKPADGVRDVEIPAVSPIARKLGYSYADAWAVPVKSSGHTITWRIWLPEFSSVGLFWLKAEFVSGTSVYLPEDVAIIFNPLSKYDDTFVEGQDVRDEYLWNEFGLIYKGTDKGHFSIPWAYDQFNVVNLVTSLNLLQGATLAQRRSPVYVSRRLSAKINSNQDRGLLKGKWPSEKEGSEDPFEGGRAPATWESSTDIFELYTFAGTKKRVDETVEYGQCWVFAGSFTSALRSLGIASRPVTNYLSAHEDLPFDGVIDRYWKLDEDEDWVEDDRTKDGVWNYHVWNEAWFRRRDLDGGDGWQIVDATPQEPSVGPSEPPFLRQSHQCGPASVAKINAGDVATAFDADFVNSELNGVLREHFFLNGAWQSAEPRRRHFGRRVLTKATDAACSNEVRAAGTSGAYASACSSDLRASGHYAEVDVPLPGLPDGGASDTLLADAPAQTSGAAAVEAAAEAADSVAGEDDGEIVIAKAEGKESPEEVAPTSENAVENQREEEAVKEAKIATQGPEAVGGKDARESAAKETRTVEPSRTAGELAKIALETAAAGESLANGGAGTEAGSVKPGVAKNVADKRAEGDGLVFTFESPEVVAAGQPFEVTLSTTPGGKADSGTIAVAVVAIDYRGKTLGKIKTESADINQGSSTVAMEVNEVDYAAYLGRTDSLRVIFSGVVPGSAPFIETKSVLIAPPTVTLSCPQSVESGTEVRCKVSVVNPLSVPLTDVEVHVHLSGHAMNKLAEPVARAVAPGAKFERDSVVVARTPGKHAVIVSLRTSELLDLEASTVITVDGEAIPMPKGDQDPQEGTTSVEETTEVPDTEDGVPHDIHAAEHTEVIPDSTDGNSATSSNNNNNNNNAGGASEGSAESST